MTTTITDRRYRTVDVNMVGYRTTRALKVGDYVKVTSTYSGATDWHKVLEISSPESARFGRGNFRRITFEGVATSWDENGAWRPSPKRETFIMFTNDVVEIARPV